MISLAFMALFFSAWQFVISGPVVSNPMPMSAPPVPTPLAQTAQSTSTEISLENCEMMVYAVQRQDTLAEIASRFSVPEDLILAANNLSTESIYAKRELVIPICNSTPTGTAHPATFTTTYTPILKLITATPDG
jgi:LysM repeat protein